MKYRILHNTPLEFFNTSADLVGSITANGTNLKISSVSGVIELGNTATDIQVGTIGTAVNWSFMGGGTIGAAGGGTISLGQSGDTVNMNVAGVTYQYPATFLRFNQITGVNNKIDISTSVPGSVILTLPNRPVVGQLSLTDNIAATSNTTGTLQVAGGVGVTGNLFAGNVVSLGTVTATRFISTQATGTAPFDVTSTTVVTNLNADLLDGLNGTSYANAAFTQASFNQANTAQNSGVNAQATATGGFSQANTAAISAQAAFNQANSAFNQANTATTSAQAAFNLANTSSQQAFSNVTVNGVLLSANNRQTNLQLTSGNGVTLLANTTATSINVQLTSTGVTAGTYGSANTIPVITIDTQGRITFANAVSSGSGSSSGVGYPNSSVSTIYGSLSSKDLRTGPDNVTAETPFAEAVDAFGVLVSTVYDCMDPIGSYVTFDLNT